MSLLQHLFSISLSLSIIFSLLITSFFLIFSPFTLIFLLEMILVHINASIWSAIDQSKFSVLIFLLSTFCLKVSRFFVLCSVCFINAFPTKPISLYFFLLFLYKKVFVWIMCGFLVLSCLLIRLEGTDMSVSPLFACGLCTINYLVRMQEMIIKC